MPVSFYCIDIYRFVLCSLHTVGWFFSFLLTSSLKSVNARCNIIAFFFPKCCPLKVPSAQYPILTSDAGWTVNKNSHFRKINCTKRQPPAKQNFQWRRCKGVSPVISSAAMPLPWHSLKKVEMAHSPNSWIGVNGIVWESLIKLFLSMAANKNRFAILSMHQWTELTESLPTPAYSYKAKIFHCKDPLFLPSSKIFSIIQLLKWTVP